MEKPDRLTEKTEPKKGVPSLDEWQDFFARIFVRALIDAYLTFALGDFFDELSPAEAAQITLSKEDLAQIAVPMATTANSVPFLRKHGRTIIAFGDTYESLLMLGLWMRRVNRIARKHGKRKRERAVRGQVVNRNRREQTSGNDSGHASGEGESAPINGFGGIYNPGGG